MDVESLRQLFGDLFANSSLAVRSVGDSVLWRAIGQILLLETMLIHQEAQRTAAL